MLMNQLRTRRQSGFTLLELLVAIALMVFLMGLIVQIFLTSTQVFNRAKAKTEIYQNARYAMDRMGKEINNCISTELLTQDFRVGWPVGSGSTTSSNWYGDKATTLASDPDGGPAGTTVTRPYLVMVTSTSWIDLSGKQQIGTARVAYRIRRYSIPDALETVSCTLERVLYTPAAFSPSTDPWSGGKVSTDSMRLKDTTASGSPNIPTVDYCQFLYFEEAPDNIAHFAVQYFDTGSSPKNFKMVGAGALVSFANLPPSVRVIMDVIDEKDREIRTLSRQFTIFASK